MNYQRFRMLFHVQEHTPANDMEGTPESWNDVATVWGDIRPISGNEFAEQETMRATNRHTITTRHYGQANPRQRLVCNGRVFEVSAAFPVNGRNYWTQWTVTEVV